MANVIFKVGTKALFDALEQKDTNTLYWLEDVQELYKGNLLFATGKTASETAAGLMSADDKIKLDSRNRQISLRIKRPPSQCLCIEMAACSSIMI